MGGGEDHSEPLSPSSTQQCTLGNALLGYKHLEVALISFVLSSRIDPHIKKKKKIQPGVTNLGRKKIRKEKFSEFQGVKQRPAVNLK